MRKAAVGFVCEGVATLMYYICVIRATRAVPYLQLGAGLLDSYCTWCCTWCWTWCWITARIDAERIRRSFFERVRGVMAPKKAKKNADKVALNGAQIISKFYGGCTELYLLDPEAAYAATHALGVYAHIAHMIWNPCACLIMSCTQLSCWH